MKSTVQCQTFTGEELREMLNNSLSGLDKHPLNPVIRSATFVILPSQTIVCEIIMGEGHAVVNFSRPIDPEMYDEGKGIISAFTKTRDDLWGVLAYRAKLENDPKLISKLTDLYKA